MDNKVKITLVTTGVLLLLIISYGLYSTFNPEVVKKSNVQEPKKQQMQTKQRVRARLGEKSNLDIRANDYYFPKKKVQRKRVDPNGYMVEESEDDGFFESEEKKVFDMTADFDDDYVPPPDVDGSMDQAEMDDLGSGEF